MPEKEYNYYPAAVQGQMLSVSTENPEHPFWGS